METKPKTILYVDDDADDLAMFRLAIETVSADYHIVEAFDGVHALEMLRQMEESNELPSLIVLDINMPRMDGKQTLVAIQHNAVWAGIPIVLFSTSSNEMDRLFSESKKVELVTKPFSFESLRAVTHKMLHQHAV